MECRRAFQRALVVPGPQLEALWRQYEQFEQAGSNRALARRILDEQRPRCSLFSFCQSMRPTTTAIRDPLLLLQP